MYPGAFAMFVLIGLGIAIRTMMALTIVSIVGLALIAITSG